MKKKAIHYTIKYSYLLAFALTLLGISPLYVQENPQTTQPPVKETWITVYVHGIMSIKSHVNLGNFFRFLRDDVENTVYSKTVELMRQDSFFYQNQAMQGFGMQKIEPDVVKKGNSSGAIAYLSNEMEALCGLNNDNHYYTFGWSGLLSAKRRYKDARDLFDALEKLVKEFQSQGIQPKIRIIGYSHGGNVVLNIGAVHHKDRRTSTLSIDEAVLLGMPVQEETDYWINDPIFKHVYHFYSNKDRVQKLDFFSPSRVSDRTFKPRRGFILPHKLTQVKIKIIRLKKDIRCKHRKFRLTFNFNNPSIVSGKSNLLRNASPGHVELWFFGWTPVHYRTSYPLYPLPTLTFIPMILHNIRDIADTTPPTSSVVADLRLQHEIMIIKQKKPRKNHKIVPLLTRQKFDELTDTILQYAPDIYNCTLYKEHIDVSYKKATALHKQERIERRCRKPRHHHARRYCGRRRRR